MDDLEELVLDFQRDYAQSVVDEMVEVPMDMDWLFADFDASAPIDVPGMTGLVVANMTNPVVANMLVFVRNRTALTSLRMVQMMTEPLKYHGTSSIPAQFWTTMSLTLTGII